MDAYFIKAMLTAALLLGLDACAQFPPKLPECRGAATRINAPEPISEVSHEAGTGR